MNSDMERLKNRLIEETQIWYALGCEHYHLSYAKLGVVFTLKSRVAGTACTLDRTIDYNLIIASDNEDAFIKRTIPHEVAHIIAGRLYPTRKAHGREWKSVMSLFGVDSTRCHSYDTSNVKRNHVKRFLWTCPCKKNFLLSTRKHNRAYNNLVLTGLSGFICRKCGYQIDFVKEYEEMK